MHLNKMCLHKSVGYVRNAWFPRAMSICVPRDGSFVVIFFISYHSNGCTKFCCCCFLFSTINIVIRQPCKDDEISVTVVELTGFYCSLRFPWNWIFKKFITNFLFAAQAWILLVIVAALPFMMMKMTRCLVARLRWQTRKGLRSV